jgi:hypothetical protein
MKTLYQRLRPQVIDQMNQFYTRFPYTVDRVTMELKDKHSVTEMTINSALFFTQYVNGKRQIDFHELADLFENPEL